MKVFLELATYNVERLFRAEILGVSDPVKFMEDNDLQSSVWRR